MRNDVEDAAPGLLRQARSLEPTVSWPAIFAGAVVGLAVAIMLSVLAAGFGLSIGFPGLSTPSALTAFTPALGAWAMVVQVLAGALAGYIAGRLRSAGWTVHDDEAHFRDTAHGLIAWALSMVAGVILAATVLAPYAEHLAGPPVLASAGLSAVAATRAADIAAQSSFFTAVGMLLSAFVAAVAARLGGLQNEAMHAKAPV